MNAFLNAVSKHNTYTENGAVSHSTTGTALLDYFSNAGSYRDRNLGEVYADISRIWDESPKITLQLLFYLRMITRRVEGSFSTEKVQKGQGAKDEFRKAITWLINYKADIFYKNMWLIPLVGCWKDLWHQDLIDVIDNQKVYQLISQGLQDSYNRELIAKYIPTIRSKRNTKSPRRRRTNRFARGLCKYLGWTEKQYRKFKASGKAHDFQRKMVNNQWSGLNFNQIPGKALTQLATNHGKKDNLTTLERHGLEKSYIKWIKSKPVAKFTGYPFELMKKVSNRMSLAEKFTVDKQFEGLLEKAKKDAGGLKGNVWCALDTSGSMTWESVNGHSAYDICVSLGIYFSTLNEGVFKNHVIMFDEASRILKLAGTFSDKVNQIKTSKTAWGNTNFQSVIDEIVRVRQTCPKIPVADYPETLLVISDMQFDPTGTTETNHERAKRKLNSVGLPDIQVIWWQVIGRTEDFPSTQDDTGTMMISGFDGAIITNILGGEQTVATRKLNPYENMLKVLNQELLNQVTLL